MEKRKDDLVKLVNISARGTRKVDGKDVQNEKYVVTFTYGSNSRKVDEFLVLSREEAEHAIEASRRATENRYVLAIEELPEGQRTQESLSKAGEEVNKQKGLIAEMQDKIAALEEERIELLNDNAKLRSQLDKAKEKAKR